MKNLKHSSVELRSHGENLMDNLQCNGLDKMSIDNLSHKDPPRRIEQRKWLDMTDKVEMSIDDLSHKDPPRHIEWRQSTRLIKSEQSETDIFKSPDQWFPIFKGEAVHHHLHLNESE
jgi:hypothetical protein